VRDLLLILPRLQQWMAPPVLRYSGQLIRG
jgi:hypothetical protein